MSRPWPTRAVTVVRVSSGTPYRSRAAVACAGDAWWRSYSVTMATGATAGAAQGVHGVVRDLFGAHDDGPPSHVLPVQVHGLLQLAGGEHPGGPCPGHEPGGARPFTRAGGEDDGPRAHLGGPVGSGGGEGQRARPAEGGDPGAQPDSGAFGGGGPAPDVGGSVDALGAGAEAPVEAVARYTARFAFAFQDLDPARAERGETRGCGEPGGPGSDDEDIDVTVGAAGSAGSAAGAVTGAVVRVGAGAGCVHVGVPPARRSRSRTAAPQWEP